MDRFRTAAIAAICGLLAPLLFLQISFADPDAVSPDVLDKNISNDSAYIDENYSAPKAVLDLVKASRAKYVEGSNLIKSGDAAGAREAFDKSVDILLQSNWDLISTPVLNRYFQDLVNLIKEDESRYLQAPSVPEETEEVAVSDELNKLDLIPLKIDPSLEFELIENLPKTKYEIPITVNEMVLKSLDFWLNRGRKFFVDGLMRSGQYRPMIEKVFREEQIPLDIMYLAQVESLFKPNAVSKAQAKGIWQFEKATAIRYGLKVTRDVDERSDPEKSTRAAAHYLNDLFAMFKDWNLVLAAYNWGEGAVQRLINNTGMNDFWQLVDLKRRMPEETKNHVPLIQASVILGKNPEKFGLPTELFPPLKYSKVSVSKPLDLQAVAKVLSVSIDELKKLNPSLKGHITPANYPDFQLKVPAEVDSDMHDKLDDLPAAKYKAPAEATHRHKVRKGDTLMKIASKYNVTVLELRKANHLSSQKKQLAAGTWLQIPSKSVDKAEPEVKKAQSAKAHPSKLIAGKTGTSKGKTPKAKITRSAKIKAKSSDSDKPKSKSAQKSTAHQSNVKTASAKKKTHVKSDSKLIASR